MTRVGRPLGNGFDAEVARALAAIDAPGGVAAIDALADPLGAQRELDRLQPDGPILLRAGLPLRGVVGDYGPHPIDPLWLRVTVGSKSVAVVPFRLRDGERVTARRARVESIAVEQREVSCCGAPSCALRKIHTTAWLEPAQGERMAIAESLDGAEASDHRAHEFARRLAQALGVEMRETANYREASSHAAVEAATPADTAREASSTSDVDGGALARFALRFEGDRRVLRDYASAFPRSSSRRNLFISFALLATAALLWFELARALRAERGSLAIALGVFAALVSLAWYAFLGVSRFSARYVARSAPLLAIAPGSVVVRPWVARTGAVDLSAEGRLGAAIPLGEVRAPAVRPRGDLYAVELDTDHGPMDLLESESEAVATLWCDVLGRALREAAHPESRASARQRARARAQGRPGAAPPATS
jgi:hypothetical protein